MVSYQGGKMAQHISIMEPGNKREMEIRGSILKNFDRGITAVRGSLRYQEIEDKMFKESEDEVVFTTERAIPYDRWVYKSGNGSFEVHYNSKLKKVTQIYLVA